MSERLIRAIDEVKDEPEITLGEIVDRIGDEALLIVALISILPFMQPIPIPGVSTILGFVAFLQGVGLVTTGKPLLTKKMKAVKIPKDRLMMIYRAAVKFDRITSKMSVLKSPAIRTRGPRIISGLTIMVAAAFLSLPLPIPFSNLIPSLCIFFICAGLLESDVLLVIFGHAIAVTVAWMGAASYHLIVEKWF